MTKSQLIDKLSGRLADTLSKKDAELIVNILFQDMSNALNNGDKIEIRGLGSFKVISRRERIGRNPKTGEKVRVPEKKAVFFKPGKELKDRADN
ncbi:MAG: integration host factor subunit beta [Deltaproteobacteria bacterium]|nr:integration host factor subunit beta [Deltaproteobacteria bacterium]